MNEIVLAVFGVTGLLGLVSLLVPLARKLYLPYTVLIAIVGGVFGLLLAGGVKNEGMIADFLHGIEAMDVSSEVLLYIFLPPLLFAGGLVVDVRRLMDDIGPVVLLAVVAVLMCMLAVGYVVNAVSGVSLTFCLLLGAIVATTDTAAVLNIFRDIGAPRRLSIIVEGESLFNDAAAIALFAVIVEMVTSGANPSIFDGIVDFARGLLGGILFGFLLARGAAMLVPLLRGAIVTEITLTVTVAYVAFVVADHYLHVSGIIAVVAAAITFAGEARTKLSPGSWDILLTIWRQLDFWATSLIFVLAATVAPAVLEHLTWEMGLTVIAVYAAAMGARALVLFGFLPVMRVMRIAARIDNRYKLVLNWGAIRGAVTIALALAVREVSAVPQEARDFVLLMAVGFVLITLFVNATTLRLIMKALRLDHLDPHERMVRNRVMALSRARVDEQVKRVAADLDVAWPPPALETAPGEKEEAAQLTSKDRLMVGLTAIANRETELSLDYLTKGVIDRDIAETMIAHAGRVLDGLKTAGIEGYNRAWQRNYGLTRRFRFTLWLQRRFGMSGPLAVEIATRFELLLIKERLLKDLLTYLEDSVAPLIGPDIAAELRALIVARMEAMHGAIEALELQYSDFAEILRTRFLARMSLGLEEAEYRQQRDQTLISEEVFEDLQEDLKRRGERLEQRPKLDLGLKLAEILKKAPLFAELKAEQVAQIAAYLTPLIAVPGQRIIATGERGDRMYFIASGEVDVLVKPKPVRLKAGDFFGEIALLTDQRRVADVVAVGYCNFLVLRREDFERFRRGNPEIEARIRSVAKQRMSANVKPA